MKKESFSKNQKRTIDIDITGPLTQYLLDTSLSENSLYPYAFEEEIFHQIEEGTYTLDYDLLSKSKTATPSDILSHVGKLSTNDFKQAEYLMVSAITLSARAAIRGGIPPYTAYKMCDVYLQEIARYATADNTGLQQQITSIYSTGSHAMNDFSREVARIKNTKKQNLYIEQCKDFVSRHIHIKFQIREISKSLGISEAYLSRTFTQETGQTIQQYILAQRLKAATNLLRYSGKSIGDISEYLCFHSQSRFTESFRKAYGKTPSQYRREYCVVGFAES